MSNKKIIRVTTVAGSLSILFKRQLSYINHFYNVIGVSSEDRVIAEVNKIEGIRTEGIDMIRKITPFKDLKAVWQLYIFFRKKKPAIVHTHTPKACTLGFLAALFASVPNRLHTIAGLPLMETTGKKRMLLNAVKKITYACATKVYPNSKGLDEFVKKEKFTKSNKLQVIGEGSSNGVNLSHFNPALISENDRVNLIENFNYYFDEPFSDPSALPTMLLSKHTKEHVTVALSGDAGDELFLGYHRYNWMNYISKIYASPNLLRYPIAKAIGLLPNYKFRTIEHVLSQKNINEAYLSTICNPSAKWLNQELTYNTYNNKYLFDSPKNIFGRISDFDIKTYLNLDINTKVDRASMAYSLEVRSPLMDYRVVELAGRLPTQFKFEGKNQKKILKDILYRHVPKEFFDRPKAGFTMPFKDWFRNELKNYVLQELNEVELASLPCIKPHEIKLMIEDHMTGKSNNYTLIWRLLVLKQWLKTNGKGISIL